jgi:Fe-S cluster assembly protein SufD
MTALPVNLPTARDENWKYANLRGLARARFEPSAAPSADALARVAAALPAPLEGYERVVLVDGYLATSLSSVDASAAPTRSTVSRLETDRTFVDLNRRLRTETATITVKSHQKRAVEVIVVALGTSHPAIELTLAEGSELAFIERHLPLSGESTITNLAISARVGAHARLELSRIVQAGAKAQHVETLELHLGEGSSSKLVQLTTGATASRTTAFVDHAGRDSSLEWHAAALGEGTQSHDSYVRIAHSAPSARTLQQFRGIASGRSRVSFNGHMRVDATSPNAQSDQSLKCLLAGPEAEADVRPQLEIYTDAVKASHGATVGKLDPDMLFYLLSRGIPEDAAAALLKWAFVSDVLTRLPNPALRAAVEHSLEALLPGAVAARSST